MKDDKDQKGVGAVEATNASRCPFHAAQAQPLSPTGCPVSANAAEFDPFEGPYQVDPAEALRWSREQEPVFYSPRPGYWVVTRYDDVKAVFRDNQTFSPSIALEKITPVSQEALDTLKRYDYAINRTLVNEDEPAHMERRRALAGAVAHCNRKSADARSGLSADTVGGGSCRGLRQRRTLATQTPFTRR